MVQNTPISTLTSETRIMGTEDILNFYTADNPGTIGNLRRILNQGKLAGTGKIIILPVDQGFEHGPVRAFGPNPDAFDPYYHPELALDAGLNGYAAPLGFIEAIARDYAGILPLILKVNSHDLLMVEDNPMQAITGSVGEAARLGCCAIGFTIYPGTAYRYDMYGQIQMLAEEAKAAGMAVIIWSYPRGQDITKEGETAIDISCYAAHLACQLGAHIIKVKLPSDHIYQEEARKIYEDKKIPIGTLTERVAQVVKSSFNGKRMVIFSGGSKVSEDQLLEETTAIRDGGGTGSIIGRNSFQRDRKDALMLLRDMISIYKG